MRSDRILLPAPVVGSDRLVQLLVESASTPRWHLIDAWSALGKPWELSIKWSVSGAEQSAGLQLSVMRAARTCIFANSLELYGINRSTQAHEVGVQCAQGQQQTTNHLDRWSQSDGSTPVRWKVPPYALRVELMMSERSAAAMSTVRLFSGRGEMVSCPFASIPATGVPLGDVDYIDVLTPVPMMLRATFFLCI